MWTDIRIAQHRSPDQLHWTSSESQQLPSSCLQVMSPGRRDIPPFKRHISNWTPISDPPAIGAYFLKTPWSCSWCEHKEVVAILRNNMTVIGKVNLLISMLETLISRLSWNWHFKCRHFISSTDYSLNKAWLFLISGLLHLKATPTPASKHHLLRRRVLRLLCGSLSLPADCLVSYRKGLS